MRSHKWFKFFAQSMYVTEHKSPWELKWKKAKWQRQLFIIHGKSNKEFVCKIKMKWNWNQRDSSLTHRLIKHRLVLCIEFLVTHIWAAVWTFPIPVCQTVFVSLETGGGGVSAGSTGDRKLQLFDERGVLGAKWFNKEGQWILMAVKINSLDF